jgi:phage N-6-adenine-methyltransferase
MGTKIYTKAEREDQGLEIAGYAIHPAAAAFPLISGGEYQALVGDIRANGLHEPIWKFEGEILDGRNRLRACLDARIEPTFRHYYGIDPVGFVVSQNIHRRHLDESQRGMIAARLATLGRGGDQSANLHNAPSRSKAADLLNVGERTVSHGRSVLNHGVPELATAVDRGDVAISRAAEISRLPEDEQRLALDPAYGGKRPVSSVSGSDTYNSDEWYTPIEIVDAARKVLGAFDLDPATCEHAQQRIKARKFYTKDDDGLTKKWAGRVWLNPPYSQPAASQFAEKLIAEYKAGNVESAILVQNASTDTGWFHALAREAHICLTRGRINFDREDGRGSQNRYGQAFFYLGDDHKSFEEVFTQFGLVGRLRGAE